MAVFWAVAPWRPAFQDTRRYNPEDSHLHTHRREDLKSYFGERTLQEDGENCIMRDLIMYILFAKCRYGGKVKVMSSTHTWKMRTT
jgi:hypothetical protein